MEIAVQLEYKISGWHEPVVKFLVESWQPARVLSDFSLQMGAMTVLSLLCFWNNFSWFLCKEDLSKPAFCYKNVLILV
jgi:hypothetical protein